MSPTPMPRKPPPPNRPTGLMPVAQATEYLFRQGMSVHRNTLRRWWDRGYVEPWLSPSGHRLYDPRDLDRLRGERQGG